MKKLLLLSLAVAGAAGVAVAQDDYNPGGIQCFKKNQGYDLTLEWASLDCKDKTYRVGIGANDKFYFNEEGTHNVHVYGPKGFEQTITVPGFVWVSNTADDAGHVLIRTANVAWPGTGAYGGCYYPGDGHALTVIDSADDKILATVSMEDGATGRFDVLGHVLGNVAEDTWELTAVSDGSGLQGNEWIYDALSGEYGVESFVVKVQPDFADSGAGAPKTTGTAQLLPESEDGTPLMAIYPNPVLSITGSGDPLGIGNGIMLYEYSWVGDEEDGAEMWNFTGKFFVTPQHASNNGFIVFELGGKQYILYTSGEANGTNYCDAFAISEVRFANTAKSDDEMDKDVLVYRTYASVNDASALLYPVKSQYTSFNIEAVEGEPNSLYIYAYAQGGPMLKYKFTAPELGNDSGVEGVVVAGEEAATEYFNLQGIRVANPENGVYIMRQGNKTSKVIR
ncbi:MAG: hypothetical protein HDS65_03735 [Bacteroidales bacterium]|nr:hypothetical protein [Bacteroidales bacterium]